MAAALEKERVRENLLSMFFSTSEEIKDATISALLETSKEAKVNGTSELTLDEINAEISAVRASRRQTEY